MKWGDTQNLLSVIIGLNIAYTALKELRTGPITRKVEAVRYLREEVERDLEWAKALASKFILSQKHYHRQKRFEKLLVKARWAEDLTIATVWLFDSPRHSWGAAICSIVVAVAGCGALVYSTLHFEEAVPEDWFPVIVAVGFAPIYIHLLFHAFALMAVLILAEGFSRKVWLRHKIMVWFGDEKRVPKATHRRFLKVQR